MEATMFDMNDRVTTPKGNGKVAYRRMRSPDYIEVEAYSVILDSAMEAANLPPFPSITGTIFSAKDVAPCE